MRIYRAVPQGSRRARSQTAWLNALDDCPEYAVLRPDAAGNLKRVVQVLCQHADWSTMITRPGWDLLIERTGLSRSTINRVLRRLRGWGLLGTVASGSTWQTRGAHPDDDRGNLTGEYVLCVPRNEAVDASDPPSTLRKEGGSKPHAHAYTRASTRDPATSRPWPMRRPAVTRGDMLHATNRLQDESPVLARITTRRLRSLLRPWYAAGWCPAQVLYALDHSPDAALRWHTAHVRHVPGWIQHRLAAWHGHTPPVVLTVAYDLTAADVAQTPPLGERSTADVAGQAAAARQRLAETRSRARATPPRQRLGLGISLPAVEGGSVATAAEPPEGSQSANVLYNVQMSAELATAV